MKAGKLMQARHTIHVCATRKTCPRSQQVLEFNFSLGAAEHLFYQLTDYLLEKGEISLANVFVDGTKIEANANRYSFVWKKFTNKYESRLDEKMSKMVEELTGRYLMEIPSGATFEECLDILKTIAQEKNIVFVYGRGKRKSQLQRDIETLEGCIARKTKYTGYNKTFKGRNSFSKTDKDATFMRMKDDHMMNGQLKSNPKTTRSPKPENTKPTPTCVKTCPTTRLLIPTLHLSCLNIIDF